MEKVKLTKEQAEAIEQIKDKDYAINILALQKRPDHLLATLEISLIAKLLYGLVEYEIEPEQPNFQPGDIIIDLSVEGCPLIKIHTVGATELFGTWGNKNQTCVHKGNARLATPEEIYWLEMLGREKVGDFRKLDVLKSDAQFLQVFENMGCDIYGSHISPEFAGKLYSDGLLYAISPAESFKPFPKEQSNE